MIRKVQLRLGASLVLALAPVIAWAGTLTIAAAADLQFAMREIVGVFASLLIHWR